MGKTHFCPLDSALEYGGANGRRIACAASWRATLLHGALGNLEAFLQRTPDQEAEMQALLRRLGLAK